MSKKVLITALAVAGIGLSGAAFADINSANSGAGLYVGVQAGYGDTNWNETNSSITSPLFGTTSVSSKGTGFAGGTFIGYDFNQYIGIESGFVYFPKTKVTVTQNFPVPVIGYNSVIAKDSFNTYGSDLVATIHVPVADNFGLFAKAGPGYLVSDFGKGDDGKDSKTDNVDLVYGFGADYAITPNVIVDASFTRFNGNHKAGNDYQPNADLYAIGLAYKFNV